MGTMAEYLLYPEVREILERTDIPERVEARDPAPFMGFVSPGAIWDIVDTLYKDGYYAHLPADFKKPYVHGLQSIYTSPEENFWLVDEQPFACELSDLLLLSGFLASQVLGPEEIWDHERFGFDSPSALVNTVGAYVQERVVIDRDRGPHWVSERDGLKVLVEVTGDSHYDLRVNFTDITQYPTRDPFGNNVPLRPASEPDVIAGYHSTEPHLLVTTLKYISQEGIDTQLYATNGLSLLNRWKDYVQEGGGCAEHFGGFDRKPERYFGGFQHPIPCIGGEGFDGLQSSGTGTYQAYIDRGDLVLQYESGSHQEIHGRFTRDDAEPLVNALVAQSALGLGRTSAKQLLDIIKYRFSK
ncbi:MAG: hypothetical protein ACQESG_06775 [Nanobdellota archaeon]